MDIKRAIRDARIAKRWTQEELAERLDISKNQIHRWEHGLQKPSLKSIARIEQVLKVKLKV